VRGVTCGNALADFHCRPIRRVPVLREGAICPFRQQRIESIAADRIEHFREYVASTADAEVRRAEAAHRAMLERVSGASITINGTELTINEIGSENPDLAQSIRAFMDGAERVRTELIATASSDLPLVPREPLSPNPASDLRSLAKSYRDRAAQLQTQSAMFDQKRQVN
jgi:hypothetical protein